MQHFLATTVTKTLETLEKINHFSPAIFLKTHSQTLKYFNSLLDLIFFDKAVYLDYFSNDDFESFSPSPRACQITYFGLLACFMFLRGHISYMHAVPIYLTCLHACVLGVLVCPICFTFKKLNSRNSYIGFLFDWGKYLEPTWTSMIEFFANNIFFTPIYFIFIDTDFKTYILKSIQGSSEVNRNK